ncbi:hypothetical protein [Ensifer soli]|uniref:hypothetical protein n=1 Tax=Ciceribacter sp. sgz301302 TaxID=3342379 RepID=UPI0035BA0CBC
MRRILLSALVALTAATSFAATAEAGGCIAYGQTCYTKKIRAYDDYGNLVIRKVRVCR